MVWVDICCTATLLFPEPFKAKCPKEMDEPVVFTVALFIPPVIALVPDDAVTPEILNMSIGSIIPFMVIFELVCVSATP